VNVGTAKMGLLGVIAAKITRVPKVIYTCRGFRFETESGFLKFLLVNFDRLIMKLVDHVIFVSPSLELASRKYRLPSKGKSTVIGLGSSNGVNIEAFNVKNIKVKDREVLIQELQLKDKLVIGFVGRVTRQKGAYELVAAFEKLYEENQNLRLIMMGHIKCEEDFERRFRSHPGIIHIPFRDDVPLYMSLFDIFVLPSWREGFPNVPIQAAAMGIPVVVSDATGCVDSVKEGFNGKIYPVKNENQLADCLLAYVENKELRDVHGKNGMIWAKEFQPETIWNGIEQIYNTL
jgi:glycosyltransferase involved in cell wall biosynthesis